MKHTLIMSLLAFTFFSSCSGQGKHLDVGDTVPEFSLTDQDGKTFNMADHVGKQIMVIYFYPKDESSVCTKESCAFRDSFADFTALGAMVIGINAGSVASHKSFQQNHNLPFTLLSDPDKTVLHLFGVKNKLVFTGRETFIVDLTGKVVYTYNAFTEGSQHTTEALKFLKEMKK